jgi:hypothetical protein
MKLSKLATLPPVDLLGIIVRFLVERDGAAKILIPIGTIDGYVDDVMDANPNTVMMVEVIDGNLEISMVSRSEAEARCRVAIDSFNAEQRRNPKVQQSPGNA